MKDEKKILKGFFVLEGLDGCGKSTQVRLLYEKLKKSFRVRADREPTKELPLSGVPMEDVAFFTQDRQVHIEGPGGVREFLDGGGILLSDRYLFSSLAYQSQDLPFEEVLAINAHFPLPEAVFFLEIDLDAAQERIKRRGEKISPFDDIDFQNKVLKGYEKAFNAFPEVEVIRLKAALPAEEIARKIFFDICHRTTYSDKKSL